MRNLRNISRTAVRFPDSSLPLTATAWDTSTDSLICAFGPSRDQASIELRRTTTSPPSSTSIALWDAQCPSPDLECDRILNLHYFADTAVICLILEGGDIVIVRETPLEGEELLEIVGSVDVGLAAAAWSPDEELLVLVTKERGLLFMSRDFDSVAEAKFEATDKALSRHVDVGWGKRETQFLGKRARAKGLKDPTVPERVDSGALSAHDDRRARVTWRGDGQYVAVNVIEPVEEGENERRLLRVFSRDGVLDSVGEPVDGFEGPLSWRPSGNLIAGTRRTGEGAEVIFFERNGLRHGEFKLRMTKEELIKCGGVKDLHWNVDSSVLAVEFGDRVQLWTMGNYHYYLKQEIWLPKFGLLSEEEDQLEWNTQPLDSVAQISWHHEKSLRLSVSSPSQTFIFDYASTVAKGSTCQPHDHGTVVVIDGSILKITPLRFGNVPPPIAAHEIDSQGELVIDVAVDTEDSCIYTLSSENITSYEMKTGTAGDVSIKSLVVDCTTWDKEVGIPFQLSIFRGRPVVLAYDPHSNSEVLWTPSLMDGTLEPVDAGTETISTMTTSVDGKSLCVQADDGAVFGLSSDELTNPVIRNIARFPKLCPWFDVVNVGDEEIAFGLTASGQLYANHRLLVSNCTSFLTTPAHLLYTTTHHLLQFIHLSSVEDLEVPPDEPETDERCRAIERGARLVTVMPTAYSVVLQMPRGNLETIFPRALVLAGIRKSIGEKKYKKAFLACRNQRVDMNILHDHAPLQFMANVGLFLDQLKKVEYIDLFLSQLRDEDVSQTMYKETVRQRADTGFAIGHASQPVEEKENTSILTTKSKINRICDALLHELQSRKATNLQNIVTANVCQSPPDLEGGLSVVSQLRQEGEEVAEKAAEHICFLADINQLYDTALGMYDLELTLLIAQQSQKDPKEYIPYLQGLQEMQDLERRFTVDDDLGRHAKAIRSLHDMDAFDRLQKYAEKHELYSTAIDFYKYKPERLNELMRQYADFLSSRNRFKEAGVAYEFLRDYTAAIPAYKQALRWREALSCATSAQLPDAELNELASSLAEGLIESKEYQHAATVYLDYLQDYPEAARQLCKAYLFADAIRIVSLQRKPELLEQVIDAGLIEGFTSTTELLADCKSQINAQVPRLRELRLKKEQDPLAFYAGDAAAGEAGADIPDNVSLAPTDATTSGGTFMTRYTGRTNGSTLNTQTTRRTSKNKRREERKRARGKKGSVYEEEYLVNSIGRLVERVNNTGEEVSRLVEGLVRRGMREQAVAVESAMVEVVEMCEKILPEVWEVKTDQQERAGDEAVATGADAVYMDMLEGGGKKEAPLIKNFERLSLIA